MSTGFTSQQLAGLATQIFSSDPNLMGGDVPAAIGNRRLTDNERMLLRAAVQDLSKAYQQGPIRPITPQRIDELRSTVTPLKPIENTPQFDPGGKTLQVQGSNFNFRPVSFRPVDEVGAKSPTTTTAIINKDRQLAEQARMQGDMPVAPGVVKAQQAVRMEDAAQKKLVKNSTPLKLTSSQQKAIEDSYREKGLNIPTALDVVKNMDKGDLLSNPDDTTYLDQLGQVGSDLVDDVSENGVLGLVRAPVAGLTGLVSGRYELPQQAIGRWALRNDHQMTRNAMIDDEGNPTALSMAPFIAGAIATAPAASARLATVGLPAEIAEGLEVANIGYKTFQKGEKGVNALNNALEGNYAGAAGELISLAADLTPSGKLSVGNKFKIDAISGGLKGFGETGDLVGATRGAVERSVVKKAAGNLTGNKDALLANLVKTDLRTTEAALDPTNKVVSGLLPSNDKLLNVDNIGFDSRKLSDMNNLESRVDSNTPYLPNPNTVLAQVPPKKKKGGKVKKQLIAVKNKNKK
jgi:hypothetical protein